MHHSWHQAATDAGADTAAAEDDEIDDDDADADAADDADDDDRKPGVTADAAADRKVGGDGFSGSRMSDGT